MNEFVKSLAEINHFVDLKVSQKQHDIDYESLAVLIESFEDDVKAQKLELLILLGYFLKTEAKKTYRLLEEYRALCIDDGKQEKFGELVAKCEKLIYPRVLTAHGYRRVIGTNNADQITDGILKVVDIISDLGHQVFINSGTLLGIVRDKNYIPYDDDVDFGLLLHASDPISAAHEWIELKDILQAKGLLRHIGWMGGILKTNNIGVFSVDLFPAWIEQDIVFVYPHTFGELQRSDLLPLRFSEENKLPIPNCPEKMLFVNYGENWKVPDPLFKFPWGKARRKFDTFLSITEVLDPRKSKL